jgi:ribonuclease HII
MIHAMPDYTLELSLPGPVVGIDEAGCGPWAGPVMAGAAILFPDKLPRSFLSELNDSKKLTAKKRYNLYEVLCACQGEGAVWASGIATVEEIDALNIRQAAMLAMRRAVEKLPVQPRSALVDGIVPPQLECFVKTVKKGDSLSLSIAAASIVAKVERDLLMQKLAQEFPHYGWHTNAGYGTATHMSAIKQFGITVHHRKTYSPIAALLVA